MAPKKQSQRGQGHKKNKNDGKGKTAPQVQISLQTEHKLRRLLLNNASKAPAVPTPTTSTTTNTSSSSASISCMETMADARKTKKILDIYDKLASEGFTNDQIERALTALSGMDTTLEAALDWLCLNIPGNELPSKFSSGVSFHEGNGSERSVNVILTSSENWVPSKGQSRESTLETLKQITPKPKKNTVEDEDDSLKNRGADWIRHYMSQQDEDEYSNGATDGNEGDSDWELWHDPSEQTRRKQLRSSVDPVARAKSIVEEFEAARQAASDAKRKHDKQKQEVAGRLIRDLKQEMHSLGISEDIISRHRESSLLSQVNAASSTTSKIVKESIDKEMRGDDDLNVFHEHELDTTEPSRVPELENVVNELNCTTSTDVDAKDAFKADVEQEEELFGLFEEEESTSDSLPKTVMEMQKKVKAIGSTVGQTKSVKQEKWSKNGRPLNKEDIARQPKAILQQECQKNGWEAPKYEKISGKANAYAYKLRIVRPSTGRGKSKKAGGVFEFQFPELDHLFESIDDAQNGVATLALFRLFPDLSLYQILSEPYRSFVMKWSTDDGNYVNNENARREDFVKSLVVSNIIHGKSSDAEGVEEKSKHKELVTEHISEIPVLEASKADKESESHQLRRDLEEKMRNVKYQMMLESRKSLPVSNLKEEFLSLMKKNDVVVVSGETGCGKTTQVPQYILDDMIQSGQGGYCNIICTQPRRIAAIAVAERVTEERCESPPGSQSSLVGYHVRLDSSWNSKTKLLFCTTGILLRKLIGDPFLKDVSHVIVDEVHERTVLGDFLLIILRDIVDKRSSFNLPKLKIILMSATMDASLFSYYYRNCPVIYAEGRTHPVTPYFLEDIYERLNYLLPSDSPAALSKTTVSKKLIAKNSVDNNRGRQNMIRSGWGDESILYEDVINMHYDESLYLDYSKRTCRNLKLINEDVIDYDLLEDLIRHIDNQFEPGAILVFLPGMAEIHLLVDRLSVSRQFGGEASEWILPLFSSMAPMEQRRVFERPPKNIRKIVVATNIAETSITIDDVVYVIDCGKHKEIRYNPEKRMSSMVETWISRANSKQRSGRAGRVKPGICFYIYTKYRYGNLMRPFQVPEMLRVPLVELCLQIKSMSLGDVFSFLEKAIEPPRKEALVSAVATLFEVGALEGDGKLTPLGYHLAKLPVDVHIGKMMLYGAIFGCLAPILTIAACLSHKSPFLSGKDEKSIPERARQLLSLEKEERNFSRTLAQDLYSDHLLLAVAYNRWKGILSQSGDKGAHTFCKKFSLSNPTLFMIRDMRIQFANLLAEIGFIELPKVDQRKKDTIDKSLDDPLRSFNMYAHEPSVIKAVLCAGLYPNVAMMDENSIKAGHADALNQRAGLSSSNKPCWFDNHQDIFIHPSSVNYSVSQFPFPFMVFLEKVQTTKVFLRDTTIISPYAVLLFGGSINIQHQTGAVNVDGWLKMNSPAQTAVLFKELRLSLHSILQELIQKPKERATIAKSEVIYSIIKLLIEEEQYRV